jgi:hypothetical protein
VSGCPAEGRHDGTEQTRHDGDRRPKSCAAERERCCDDADGHRKACQNPDLEQRGELVAKPVTP